MSRMSRFFRIVPVVLLAGLLSTACSGDPETKARKYLASGDGYAAKGQHKEASLEYGNAVKARPELAEAHYRLAKSYEASGEPIKAYGAFARAADLDPSNMDAQLQAGALLLAGGEYEAARTRAELALKADPKNPSAHILLGNALAGLNDPARAVKQMEQAIALDPSFAPAWSALGAARFVGGNKASAGEAFAAAVQLSPSSAEARLALANYQWASGDSAAAEGTLKAALALDGTNTSVHRAMALYYIVNRRAPEAEPHFKALATERGGTLALADYYAGIGRTQEATETLRGVAQAKGVDATAARLRLAAIRYAAGGKADAHAQVDDVLKDSPRHVEARIAKARMLLVDGKPDDALIHAKEAVNADRGMPSAHYTLGLIALERRDLTAAEGAFREVVKLNPRAGAAQLQLSRLQLARGDAAGALSAAEEAARQRPDDADAAVLVSRSLRAQGDLARAEREISVRLAKNPQAASLHLELGNVSLQRGQTKVARGAYEEALRLQPTLHDARIGLITADIAEKNVGAAQGRMSDWLARAPDDARLKVLSARVDLVAGRAVEAERTLRDIVTVDASHLEAYDLLGRLYISQGQVDRAISEFRTLAARSNTPAGALTMIALIHEAKGDRDGARQQYEKILVSDPRSGVAANNLAWIYAETGKSEEAVTLALIAQAELRGRPEAEDTLGWAYYHKGLTGHAIGAFERALAKSPDNPVYHYHLGLAHAKAGSDANARRSFQRALTLKADFAGADDARAKLKTLGTD